MLSGDVTMTRVAFAALAGLLLASAAHAQSTPPQTPAPGGEASMRGGMAGMREACAADMKTYCGDAGQDRGARRECMMSHHTQFSQGCQDAIAKMQAWRQSRPHDGGGSPQ
jgi:hypothetical protein